MKICLLCEGSYPYVAGGVASWVHSFVKAFDDCEFVIVSIATNAEEMHTYRYEVPPNVTEIITGYLSDTGPQKKWEPLKLTRKEFYLLDHLLRGQPKTIRWQDTVQFVRKYQDRLSDLLNSESFYDICLRKYQETEEKSIFSHYLWNMRGMFMPFFRVLCTPIPDADIYHSLSTGYSGLAATIGSVLNNRPFVLSEHGIYTREREEDIIRATWLDGDYKELWIEFFKKLSAIAYDRAEVVTTLFDENGSLQVDLGCDSEKIRRIPNGIDPEEIRLIHQRTEESRQYFNFGAVLRVVPIKDLKTMIIAFAQVRRKISNVRLHIYGNYDEAPDYYYECVNLIHSMGIPDITFYGQVNIREYLHDIDVLLLTSISEGQPLSILEGFALHIPCISTNVGSCKELLYGKEGDDLGHAGMIVPVMDVDALAKAMTFAAQNRDEMIRMGEVGYQRVVKYYQKKNYLKEYRQIYETLLRESSDREESRKQQEAQAQATRTGMQRLKRRLHHLWQASGLN